MPAGTEQVRCVPFESDLVDGVAQHIITGADGLPDLTPTWVLVDEPRVGIALRDRLLHHAGQRQTGALLGPNIQSLRHWWSQFIPAELTLCDDHSRTLILVEALREHPALLGDANPWSLADSLLTLFDELTTNRIELPEDVTAFTDQLYRHYHRGKRRLGGLEREAQLVHQLWFAWHQQLLAHGLTDPHSAMTMAWRHSLKHWPQDRHIHLLGFEPANRGEQRWLQQALEFDNVVWWVQAEPGAHPGDYRQGIIVNLLQALGVTPSSASPASDFGEAMRRIFTRDETALLDRAGAFANDRRDSPLQERLRVFSAADAEQEARAIDIQVRRWLIEGHERIAIVTENRRLARRIRALLERADIILQDAAGWALSTTRAAAALEALLECVEEDFAHTPLLDLLKAPFIFYDVAEQERKAAVYRLEEDIIQHENIGRNLERYRYFIADRQKRLRALWPEQHSMLDELLQRLDDATQPLRALFHGTHAASEYVQALRESLEALAMAAPLQADAAGSHILQVLDGMHQGARHAPVQLDWSGFRAWLGRNFECAYFRPTDTGSPVQLLNLHQARLLHFDAMVMAGAEREYLPGSTPSSPFFNNAVRGELHLPDQQQHIDRCLYEFNLCLHHAPNILITHRLEQEGEPVPRSPWVDLITDFHRLAYKTDLQDTELGALTEQREAEVTRCDTRALPEIQTRPMPSPSPEVIPTTVSASDYQQLLDCPYQFFAARCLKLSPPEEVRMVLSKREYGQRIHQCLQAFHGDVNSLPGPFEQSLSEDNRSQAIALLQDISERVFAADLRDNFTHRAWYHRWLAVIPGYIDWQIERQPHWQVASTEQKLEVPLGERLHIKGRLDRRDTGAEGMAIIDYKTGYTPGHADVVSGEAIQLPFYALLSQQDGRPIKEVLYLTLDKPDKVGKGNTALTDEELQTTTALIAERLVELIEQLHNGQPMPAWEDDQTCRRCDMALLCRVQTWQEG